MSDGWTGVFGKVPETGDFVAAGLPYGLRRGLDAWLSGMLAGRPGPWPEGGIRALVWIGGAPVLLCALPSEDSAGRRFPFVAATDGAGLSFETAEAWCDVFAPELSRVIAGEVVFSRLREWIAGLPDLPRDAEDGVDAIWTRGGPPFEPDAESVKEIFSSA